jgi:ABC-type nitrate/sulfonate/bicarbonate transport system substrate-binding protein
VTRKKLQASRKHRRRCIAAVVALAATAVGLWQVAVSPASVSHSKRASLTTLVVASTGQCVCHGPIPVGIAEGFYAKNGIALKMVQVPSGFQALSQLLTGNADIADAAPSVAAEAESNGVSATAVLFGNGDASGTKGTDKFFGIVARPGSGIRPGHPEDLEGKTVATALGTIAHQYFYSMTLGRHIPLSSIHVVNVSPPDWISALESGSVDAFAGWEPQISQALQSIPGSYVVYRGGNYIQYLFMRWISPRLIATNPQIVQGFVNAYVESMWWMRHHRAQTLKILDNWIPQLPPSVIASAYSYLDLDPRYSLVTQRGIDQAVGFAQATGGMKGDYNFAEHWDPRFLATAEKQHPQWFSDLPPIRRAWRKPGSGG